MVIGENGENINPDVVEQAFDVHEALNFSVLGIKNIPGVDSTTNVGERICMVVSLSRDTEEETVQELCERIYKENSTLPVTHQVKEFYFTYDPIMPKTAIKVGRKYLLRGIEDGSIKLTPFKEFKVKSEEAGIRLSTKTAEKVREIIAEGAGVSTDEVGDDDHLMNDLGCDSLTYYGILIKICNVFDIEVEGPVETELYTLREICDKLEEGGKGIEG